MRLLFSSPRTIRRLLVLIALLVLMVYFTVELLVFCVADGNARGALVVLGFDAFCLWWIRKSWDTFRADYRYGVRLHQLMQAVQSDQRFGADAGMQTDAVCTQNLDGPVHWPVLKHATRTEKLRLPWPSAICVCLSISVFFIGMRQPVSTWSLLAFCVALWCMNRPLNRWTTCSGSTEPFAALEASDRSILPVDKHWCPVDDSNFYRFHRHCLTDLGFRQIGTRRYRHYFARPDDRVVVVLGRDIHARWEPDYLTIVSIDDAGNVFESHSNASGLSKIADANAMWQVQSIDAGDVPIALERHQRFVNDQIEESARLVALSCCPAVSEHIHEVSARARISYFNENQIAFA